MGNCWGKQKTEDKTGTENTANFATTNFPSPVVIIATEFSRGLGRRFPYPDNMEGGILKFRHVNDFKLQNFPLARFHGLHDIPGHSKSHLTDYDKIPYCLSQNGNIDSKL